MGKKFMHLQVYVKSFFNFNAFKNYRFYGIVNISTYLVEFGVTMPISKYQPTLVYSLQCTICNLHRCTYLLTSVEGGDSLCRSRDLRS